MVKFSPVVLASVFAYTNALNVDQFIQDAMTQIYSNENGVEKVSLEPYLAFTKTEKRIGSSQVTNVVGSYGMGNGAPIKFTRKFTLTSSGAMKFETSDAGNFANTLWGVLFEEINGLDFQENMHFEVHPQQMKANWGNDGHVDNKKFSMNQEIQVTNFKQQRKQTAVTLASKGSYSAHPFIVQVDPLHVQPFDYNVEVAASYNNVCEGPMGPLTNGCSMKLGITGECNNDDINNSIQTTASDDQFKVTGSANNKKAFVAKVDYNGHDLYELSFKNVPGQFINIVSVPGPARHAQIAAEFESYIAPFSNYAMGMAQGPEVAARAIVWVDVAFNDLTNEFDCSALVESTGFDSALLAQSMNAPNMQAVMQQGCVEFNNMAVQGAQQVGAMIGQARGYVNELTDPKKGGKDFNKWYKSIYA